jgi:hypothetical protein
VNKGRSFAKQLTSAAVTLAFVLSLSACQSNQPRQQTGFTPAEEQKFKEEQEKAQKQMKVLTTGMGQTLSKTPTSPTTDPAAEWRKTHPRKQTAKSQAPSTAQP